MRSCWNRRRLPPPIGRSAGEELFGAWLEALAASLDEGWLTRNGESWHERRAQYLDRRMALDRLSAIASPTPDELFDRAKLIEILDGADQALPEFPGQRRNGSMRRRAWRPAAWSWLGWTRRASGCSKLPWIATIAWCPTRAGSCAESCPEADQELAARKCECGAPPANNPRTSRAARLATAFRL